MLIQRGDVVIVDLDPIIGSEQGKTRPCVIIQNNIGNKFSSTTIIATITSKLDQSYPYLVCVLKGEGNLLENSYIQLNQIRSISITRIKRKLGSLSEETMHKVDNAIKISLGLD